MSGRTGTAAMFRATLNHHKNHLQENATRALPVPPVGTMYINESAGTAPLAAPVHPVVPSAEVQLITALPCRGGPVEPGLNVAV
jgi:hypothetical protein